MMLSTMPYRAYRMDDILAGEIIGSGDLSLSSLTTVQFPTLLQELRAGCAMDRAVYTTSAK